MKKLLVSSLFLIVLVSLCTNLPNNFPIAFPQPSAVNLGATMDMDSSDISFSASSSISQIRIGRDLILSFSLINKQGYDLTNVDLQIYDNPCFSGANQQLTLASFKANATRSWTWKFTPNSGITLEKTCPIRFKLSYEGKSYFYQDIAVLPEAEYLKRESEGTLGSVPIRSSSSISPLGISMRFSESQPFIGGQTYYMFVEYASSGQGMFEDTTIKFIPTSNIALSCGNYLDASNNLKSFSFIRGSAPTTTCSFDTDSVSAIDIKSMEITATYKYVLDNSISVTVNP